jgi:hypothetical protein
VNHYLSSFIILLAFLLSATADAQQLKNISRNTLYADFAIKGATYSVNYDRVFSNNAIAVPLGLQFFSGKNTHHVEYSLTIVPYIEKYQDISTGNNESDKKIYILPGAGYRYQPPTGGLFAKIVIGPLIYLDPASDNFWHMEGKVYPGITAGAGFSF